jgi:hypothetical protein
MNTFNCKYCNNELSLTKNDNTQIICRGFCHYECYHSNVTVSYVVINDNLYYTKFYNDNFKYALEIDHILNNLVLYLAPHIFIQRFKFIFDDIAPNNFDEKVKLLMVFS